MSHHPSPHMPRRCNCAAGKAPPHANDGLLGGFSRHRCFNSQIARDLMHDTDTREIGRKIANCALTLKAQVLLHPETKAEVNLQAARVCNTRLCPFCEWRRSRVWRKRLYEGLMAVYEDNTTLKGVFLTLTAKSVPLEELGEQLDEMSSAWNRMTKRAFWPTDFWFRRTEITVGSRSFNEPVFAHPHFHVLLLVPANYFGKNYVKQIEWAKQWGSAMRLDYQPVIDVRAAKKSSKAGQDHIADAKSAVIEASKYATKATQLQELGHSVAEYHHQVRGKRLYAVSRPLSKYIKAEEISSAEMMDTDSKPLPPGTDTVDLIAEWFEDSSEYLIKEIVDLS